MSLKSQSSRANAVPGKSNLVSGSVPISNEVGTDEPQLDAECPGFFSTETSSGDYSSNLSPEDEMQKAVNSLQSMFSPVDKKLINLGYSRRKRTPTGDVVWFVKNTDENQLGFVVEELAPGVLEATVPQDWGMDSYGDYIDVAEWAQPWIKDLKCPEDLATLDNLINGRLSLKHLSRLNGKRLRSIFSQISFYQQHRSLRGALAGALEREFPSSHVDWSAAIEPNAAGDFDVDIIAFLAVALAHDLFPSVRYRHVSTEA